MSRASGSGGSISDAQAHGPGRGVRRRSAASLRSAAALVALLVATLILVTGSDEATVKAFDTGDGQLRSDPTPSDAQLDPVFDASTTVPPSMPEAPAPAVDSATDEWVAPSTPPSTTQPEIPSSEQGIPYGCDYFPPCGPTWVDPRLGDPIPPAPPPPTFPPAPPVGPEDLPAAFEELITSLVDLNALLGGLLIGDGQYLYNEAQVLERFENADGTSTPISDELRAIIVASAAPIRVTFVSEAPEDFNGAFTQLAVPLAEGNAFLFTGRIECGMCQGFTDPLTVAVAKEADGCWHLDYYSHSFIYGSAPMC
ncbi:MAG: hypothetical protein JJLCMIEE_01891 [Acidimicrobiales bacterium]|nr:MAG: hypothetical protein EDR02_10530 [Actinomycetota bacterium]MBV6508825.1 hypothetical protein [Acidimicrobiales bacterium]RIK04954.1 MAG: hypothetical protein DCC48_11410 [Acidobacteriota bacterium]